MQPGGDGHVLSSKVFVLRESINWVSWTAQTPKTFHTMHPEIHREEGLWRRVRDSNPWHPKVRQIISLLLSTRLSQLWKMAETATFHNLLAYSVSRPISRQALADSIRLGPFHSPDDRRKTSRGKRNIFGSDNSCEFGCLDGIS
jgi:hypothetical protein